MRYPAEKIKEAILHSDKDVREAAVYYFTDSYSSDPTIMPLVIQAIEKYGYGKAFQSFDFLDYLVLTDESVRWLIQRIRASGEFLLEKEAEPISAYISALVFADPAVLQHHEADIMALEDLDDDSRKAISERIQLLSRTGEELWEEFETFCETHEGEHEISDEDFAHADRVVEALGRHRDQFAEKVLAIIGSPGDEYVSLEEGFANRLAGEMKLEAAIPLMMTALNDGGDEWLDDECHDAFTKMGSEKVIAYFAESYATNELFGRMSMADTLGNIRSDRAVQTCLDFLKIEKDKQIKTVLLQSVLDNFATEGIEPARQTILHARLNPEMRELRAKLLTACKLMGETFPEFDAWVTDNMKDQETPRRWRQEYDIDDDSDEIFEEEDFEAEEDFEEEKHEEPPLAPIVRKEARIGRNDPCPCGSGKKFKKCCYVKT